MHGTAGLLPAVAWHCWCFMVHVGDSPPRYCHAMRSPHPPQTSCHPALLTLWSTQVYPCFPVRQPPHPILNPQQPPPLLTPWPAPSPPRVHSSDPVVWPAPSPPQVHSSDRVIGLDTQPLFSASVLSDLMGRDLTALLPNSVIEAVGKHGSRTLMSRSCLVM